jgi:glycosyltransferase involved in cell wall biosynthesis
MKKSVLILSPQPFFETRGTPLNVREMLHALSEKGYSVTLLAYPFGQDLIIPNVKIIRSAKVIGINTIKIGPSYQKIILDIFFFLKALKLALTNSYDLFHGIEEAAHMACVISRIKRKPFIADVDSCIPEQLKSSGFITNNFLLGILVFVEKICFGRAARVLTVCKALTDQVKKIQPCARVTQIEDFPMERVDSNKTINLRQAYNIAEDQKIIVYAGNFEQYQGVDLLIRSFSQLKHIKAHLVLVGGNDQHIQNYKKLALNLNSENDITFTNALDSELMPSIHAQADLLVSPRLTGTNTPLKIYSYMSAERLILATNIISHTQVLSDKEAILSKPELTDFTANLERALTIDAGDKIAAAKNLVETKYSRLRFKNEIQRMYHEVLCQ